MAGFKEEIFSESLPALYPNKTNPGVIPGFVWAYYQERKAVSSKRLLFFSILFCANQQLYEKAV